MKSFLFVVKKVISRVELPVAPADVGAATNGRAGSSIHGSAYLYTELNPHFLVIMRKLYYTFTQLCVNIVKN